MQGLRFVSNTHTLTQIHTQTHFPLVSLSSVNNPGDLVAVSKL